MRKQSLIYTVLLSMLIMPGLASAQSSESPPGLQAVPFPTVTSPPEVTVQEEEPEEEEETISGPPSIQVVPAPEPTPDPPLPAPPEPTPEPPKELPETGPGLLLSLIPAAGYAIRKKLK